MLWRWVLFGVVLAIASRLIIGVPYQTADVPEFLLLLELIIFPVLMLLLSPVAGGLYAIVIRLFRPVVLRVIAYVAVGPVSFGMALGMLLVSLSDGSFLFLCIALSGLISSYIVCTLLPMNADNSKWRGVSDSDRKLLAAWNTRANSIVNHWAFIPLAGTLLCISYLLCYFLGIRGREVPVGGLMELFAISGLIVASYSNAWFIKLILSWFYRKHVS